jgi:hypothetical protein
VIDQSWRYFQLRTITYVVYKFNHGRLIDGCGTKIEPLITQPLNDSTCVEYGARYYISAQTSAINDVTNE